MAEAGSAVGHRPLEWEFESRTKSEGRFIFHVASLHSELAGLTNLAYHVHKSGRKTTTFNFLYITCELNTYPHTLRKLRRGSTCIQRITFKRL